MNKTAVKRVAVLALLCAGLLLVKMLQSYGQESAEYSQNPDTGYQVLIEDEAGLLTDGQRLELSRIMEKITAYGNAAFVTTGQNPVSTEEFARDYYRKRFGTSSGTVFVIDMDRRNIWIHSDGAVYQAVTSADADIITDNIYRYASKGDYGTCAAEGFNEIFALLEGEKIARPMKYISNALLAVIIALFANFGLVCIFAGLREPKERDVLAGIQRIFRYTGLKAVHTHQTRQYDPVSTGGGHHGGGGRSGGGGSRGGGGRSGGGGGHRFFAS